MSAFIELGGAEPVYITHNVLIKVCRDFGNDARNNFGLRLVISFCKSFWITCRVQIIPTFGWKRINLKNWRRISCSLTSSIITQILFSLGFLFFSICRGQLKGINGLMQSFFFNSNFKFDLKSFEIFLLSWARLGFLEAFKLSVPVTTMETIDYD